MGKKTIIFWNKVNKLAHWFVISSFCDVQVILWQLCGANCHLSCALVKVNLCDVWGQGLYYVHICNKFKFIDFSIISMFSILFKNIFGFWFLYFPYACKFEFLKVWIHLFSTCHKFECFFVHYKSVVNYIHVFHFCPFYTIFCPFYLLQVNCQICLFCLLQVSLKIQSLYWVFVLILSLEFMFWIVIVFCESWIVVLCLDCFWLFMEVYCLSLLCVCSPQKLFMKNYFAKVKVDSIATLNKKSTPRMIIRC